MTVNGYYIEEHGETVFYDWLENVLSVANGYKLECAAELPKDALKNHQNAVLRLRLQKDGELDAAKKLQNQHFAAVARAIMKATGGTIGIRWDTFQLNIYQEICVHMANQKGRTVLVTLTDDEFNGLF